MLPTPIDDEGHKINYFVDQGNASIFTYFNGNSGNFRFTPKNNKFTGLMTIKVKITDRSSFTGTIYPYSF